MATTTSVWALVAVGYVAAFGVTLALTVYASFYRKNDVARWFGATMASLALWSLGALGRLFATTPGGWRLGAAVMYLGIVTLPVWFLLFALSYAGRAFDRRLLVGLLVVPAFSYLALITDPVHGLFYGSVHRQTFAGEVTFGAASGVLFWAHTLYSYVLLFAGVGVVLGFVVGNHRIYREQSVALVAGVSVPLVVNAAYITGALAVPVDPTPIAFALSGVLFSLAVFEVRLIGLTPVARSAVVNAISDGVVVVGRDDEVLDINPAAADLARVESPVGRQLADVVPPELASADDDEVCEVAIDGETRWVRRREIPLADDRAGRVVLLTDLTDERRTHRRLREQNRRLEEFTSVAAHDLRNPLNVVDGYVQVTRETGDLSHLDRVTAATDRMETLVDDLLELGQHSRVVDEREQVALEPAVREVWTAIDADGAELVVDESPGTVRADPHRLRRLLENLLDNAVVHAGPEVTVTVGLLVDRRGFYVADDGAGVPTDEHEAVFEYGFSTHRAGTGLGLPIVRGIAEAHGWSLSVADSADGGARFEVHLS